jgi:hypothetical protein
MLSGVGYDAYEFSTPDSALVLLSLARILLLPHISGPSIHPLTGLFILDSGPPNSASRLRFIPFPWRPLLHGDFFPWQFLPFDSKSSDTEHPFYLLPSMRVSRRMRQIQAGRKVVGCT